MMKAFWASALLVLFVCVGISNAQRPSALARGECYRASDCRVRGGPAKCVGGFYSFWRRRKGYCACLDTCFDFEMPDGLPYNICKPKCPRESGLFCVKDRWTRESYCVERPISPPRPPAWWLPKPSPPILPKSPPPPTVASPPPVVASPPPVVASPPPVVASPPPVVASPPPVVASPPPVVASPPPVVASPPPVVASPPPVVLSSPPPPGAVGK